MKYVIGRRLKRAATELSGMADSPIQLEIADDHLHVIDRAGDYKYMFSAITLISEIPNHFLIKLSNSQVLIIPKINTSLCNDIKNIKTTHNLPFRHHLDWKW
ncbi:MAG: YcxB family protein [Candidatus Pedobacter colombiensis]|uniref:YcxB family protein n=1 Tax=Candidatus Pedobacter colombiensis TaxID=3121371 RepID=A0AAJ6B915_9SPHI|nr:YcxB family protein [Pedobacter sp.]WEK21061.1 MAG: YcxB family protein [Pedobacter sp.]